MEEKEFLVDDRRNPFEHIGKAINMTPEELSREIERLEKENVEK